MHRIGRLGRRARDRCDLSSLRIRYVRTKIPMNTNTQDEEYYLRGDVSRSVFSLIFPFIMSLSRVATPSALPSVFASFLHHIQIRNPSTTLLELVEATGSKVHFGGKFFMWT